MPPRTQSPTVCVNSAGCSRDWPWLAPAGAGHRLSQTEPSLALVSGRPGDHQGPRSSVAGVDQSGHRRGGNPQRGGGRPWLGSVYAVYRGSAVAGARGAGPVVAEPGRRRRARLTGGEPGERSRLVARAPPGSVHARPKARTKDGHGARPVPGRSRRGTGKVAGTAEGRCVEPTPTERGPQPLLTRARRPPSPTSRSSALRRRWLDNLKALLMAIHGVLSYAGDAAGVDLQRVPRGHPAPVSEGVLFVWWWRGSGSRHRPAVSRLRSAHPGSVERKGPGRFAGDRLVRLGVPFVVFV